MLLVMAACNAASDAPVIHDFVCTPTTLSVGAAVKVQASIGFRDPNGDVASLQLTLVDTKGVSTPFPVASLSSLSGQLDGEFGASFTFTPGLVGAYQVSAQVEDAAGHESNVLEATLTAQ